MNAWIEIAALIVAQQALLQPGEETWRQRQAREDAAWFRERLRLNAEARRYGSGWITTAKAGFVLWLLLVAYQLWR